MKYFSIKIKLAIIFVCLVFSSLLVLGNLAVWISQKTVKEKIKSQLTEKANDMAELIDARIHVFFSILAE